MSDTAPTTVETSSLQAFSRDLARLLLTFLAVSVIDLVFGSFLSGQLRVWFPQWIDPEWATNPQAQVVYSQSYMAGIFLLPVLAWIVDRDFLAARRQAIRIAYWGVCIFVLIFIIIWKGELMISHDKQCEAIGFALLTAFIYVLIVIAQALPRWLADLSPRELLRRLLFVLACFFLVMSVLDPVMQIGVQGMDWSRGLIVEMVFFIPAGLALLWITYKMKRAA